LEADQEIRDEVAWPRRGRMRRAVRRRPVALLPEYPGLPDRYRAGHQLAYAAEERARPGNVAVRQVVPDGAQVGGRLDARDEQQRLDLGREVQVFAALMEEQRLLAEAVAREDHASLSRVPDREREHAAQAMDDLLAPLLIGAQQDLGVRIEREAVAEPDQLAPQLAEVVDLAVEGQREPCGVVAHRL